MLDDDKSKIEKKKNKAEAVKYLKRIRIDKAEKDVSLTVSLMHSCIEKAGIALRDIGTSKEEIITILQEGHKAEAFKYLYRARIDKAERDVSTAINLMLYQIENANVALKDIGTNEEEIANILREGHKSEAIKYLQRIRTDKRKWTASDAAISLLRSNIQEAGINPEDIGATEEETNIYSLNKL